MSVADSFDALNTAAVSPRSRGPFIALLEVFSSVWLGVILLAILFVYSSIGSSGVPVHPNILDPANWVSIRQLPWFEMTEMEWFHWWPFDLLIALICINIVITTVRKIPLNVINLGVWMIHGGIIILALGSVWYFTTKLEGMAPVNRRQITAQVPGFDPVTFIATPGNSAVVGQGDSAYELRVTNIDPHWELLSGDEAGKKAYKVSVAVRSKNAEFVRDLIADRPAYTQDIIRTNNPQQPMARAKTILGKELVDETLRLSLEYAPQSHFFLNESHALYLRLPGQTEWVQRRIISLPRYNDYIRSAADVWPEAGGLDMPLRPMKPIRLAACEPNDPLPDVTFDITRYLRYAELRERQVPSVDAPVNPAISVTLRTPQSGGQQYQLTALDPRNNHALQRNLQFIWVDSQQELERMKTRVDPVLRFSVPEANVTVEAPITQTTAHDPNLGFSPIEGSQYAYRVESFQDNLIIGNSTASVAIIQIQTPERTFRRWVFDDASRNRDMSIEEGLSAHEADLPLDERIVTEYKPGSLPPAPIVIAAGPGENDLSVVITMAAGPPRFQSVKEGEQVLVAGDVTLTIDRYAPRTLTMTKPLVIPREQRERDLDVMSLICIDVPSHDGVRSQWLRFHTFPFNRPEDVMRRFLYQPTLLALPDGRRVEVMFSRARMPLPARVALDDFRVKEHIGGFTGQTSSIMDWESTIRFATGDNDNGWGDGKVVRVNKPAEHLGYWYFQAQWDPPDPPRFNGDTGSAGLNYTVLGVGNRNGVHVQLAGCCIAVLGMIYGFYIKPVIKRQRQQRVYAQLHQAHDMDGSAGEPVKVEEMS